ncbi:hypothetical protein SUDANB105_05167 [Streptomyces sp. enrichment culture]|uniref:hypothetical protein n=1 Tax=Streptomyces sp. enrichment culture TaxID=1795815 RepID=UPI003F54EB9D
MTEVPHTHSGGEDERRMPGGGGMPQVPGEQVSGGMPQGSGGQVSGGMPPVPGGHVPPEMPQTAAGGPAQAPAGAPGPTAAGARRQSGVEAGAPRAEKASHLAPLLARGETDKLAERLQHAVTGFVDGPRAAVEEADHVLEEIADRFTQAVTQRRRTLRRSWEETDEATPPSSDTERLRLALKDYRELADRLLHH